MPPPPADNTPLDLGPERWYSKSTKTIVSSVDGHVFKCPGARFTAVALMQGSGHEAIVAGTNDDGTRVVVWLVTTLGRRPVVETLLSIECARGAMARAVDGVRASSTSFVVAVMVIEPMSLVHSRAFIRARAIVKNEPHVSHCLELDNRENRFRVPATDFDAQRNVFSLALVDGGPVFMVKTENATEVHEVIRGDAAAWVSVLPPTGGRASFHRIRTRDKGVRTFVVTKGSPLHTVQTQDHASAYSLDFFRPVKALQYDPDAHPSSWLGPRGACETCAWLGVSSASTTTYCPTCPIIRLRSFKIIKSHAMRGAGRSTFATLMLCGNRIAARQADGDVELPVLPPEMFELVFDKLVGLWFF